MTTKSMTLSEQELDELWAAFGDDRFGPLHHSQAARLAAFENARRVVGEMRRLRTGGWVEAAAREIATSPACGDVSSSDATAIARVIRRYLSSDH